MPQGQNDFHHDNVDQTVQIDKPKDTIIEREPIIQTLPENNLSRNHKNISNIQPAGLIFKCSNCSMVFDNDFVYKLHLKDARRCKHCSFTCCTKAGLKAHEKEEEKKNN